MLNRTPPQFSKQATLIAGYYDVHARIYDDQAEGAGYTAPEVAFAMLQPNIRWSDPPRLLDLGAGTGLVAREFNRQVAGIRITATDLSQNMLTKLKAALPEAECVRMNIEDGLPFSNGEFDAVTMMSVIEHVENACALFNDIARVLRPGGWLAMDSYVDGGGETQDDQPAMFGRTPHEIGAIMQDNGLELTVTQRLTKYYDIRPVPCFYMLGHKPA